MQTFKPHRIRHHLCIVKELVKECHCTLQCTYMGKTISATKARKHFFQLLKLAGKPGAKITITLAGQAPVVLMSAEQFDGWMETLEIISDPELVKSMKRGIADMKAGRVTPLEEIIKKMK